MKRRSVGAIFAAPALIAVLTAAGLVAGLLGDGWWDAASWLGLGMPVLVAAWRYRGSPAAAGPRRMASHEGTTTRREGV